MMLSHAEMAEHPSVWGKTLPIVYFGSPEVIFDGPFRPSSGITRQQARRGGRCRKFTDI